MNSDINNTPRKSSRELKAEVLNDLKKLNRDVDQLKNHLTPGQIIDDAIYYRTERTPRATFDYLKQNPVGTSFLALGTVLLMEDERNRSMEMIAREKASDAYDSARSSVEGIRSKVESRVEGVRSKVDGIRTKLGDMSENIKSKLPGKKGSEFENSEMNQTGSEFGYVQGSESSTSGSRIDDVKEKASQGLDNAKSKLSSATDAVKGQLQETYYSARHMEPLTYVVLGAGLGTLTGASLPLMEKEKNFVDRNLDERLSGFTTDLQAALNESTNILKTEFFNDVSSFDFNIFGGSSNQSRAV